MAEITITFPDKSKKKYKKGSTPLDVALSISEGLMRQVVTAKFNDKLIDSSKPLEENGTLKLLKFSDPEGLEVFRHSSAHVLAQAVLELFPESKLTIGPVVEEGFYYDIDHPPFTPEDLEKIEKRMKEIVDRKLKIERVVLSKKEALKTFKDNKYKVELIKELPDDEKITAYKQGDFIDLCRGPHVSNTGIIKAFKLTKLAGAYWKGDAKNKQLQRIYGISFPDKKELKQYLHLLEEARRRDHRKIGKQLDLFSFHEEAPGMPFFHNKGRIIYNELEKFMREEMKKRNYEENRTPIILNKSLWLKSGHWGHYKDNMYFTKIDEGDFAVKPMNCPGNLLIYKSRSHSYKELPIRAGEFGLVHRHELSGVLSGLFRVRCFTQDDAHVFCTEAQLKSEIKALMEFIDFIYKTFNFKYNVELSTKPEKAMGSQEVWDKAEDALKTVLDNMKYNYKINEGEGAFYGPKIDFHLKDAIGRTWQCGTVQVDFSMPEKFDLEYEGNDGKKHRPVMVHRAIYGSFERFLGILVEHYAGRFPLWLSPVQVKILTITDRNNKYAENLLNQIKDNGLRVELDTRSETIPKKVRDAQLEQVNYILVVGDKEQKDKTVTVRTREGKVTGAQKVDKFIKDCIKEIEEKK